MISTINTNTVWTEKGEKPILHAHIQQTAALVNGATLNIVAASAGKIIRVLAYDIDFVITNPNNAVWRLIGGGVTGIARNSLKGDWGGAHGDITVGTACSLQNNSGEDITNISVDLHYCLV